MRTATLPRLALCFALGAIAGTLLDGIHAYGDVLSYPDPAFGRWAWFVPVQFGLLGVAVGLLCPVLERAASTTPLRPSVPARVFEVGLFAFLYFLTTLPESGGASFALGFALLALAGARLAFDGAPGDWLWVVLAMVLGPAAEAVMTALGAFDYANPDFAGIPFWLPGLWANGGLMIRRLIVPLVMPTTAPRSVAAPTPTLRQTVSGRS